jgi:hypothetical protein
MRSVAQQLGGGAGAGQGGAWMRCSASVHDRAHRGHKRHHRPGARSGRNQGLGGRGQWEWRPRRSMRRRCLDPVGVPRPRSLPPRPTSRSPTTAVWFPCYFPCLQLCQSTLRAQPLAPARPLHRGLANKYPSRCNPVPFFFTTSSVPPQSTSSSSSPCPPLTQLLYPAASYPRLASPASSSARLLPHPLSPR